MIINETLDQERLEIKKRGIYYKKWCLRRIDTNM